MSTGLKFYGEVKISNSCPHSSMDRAVIIIERGDLVFSYFGEIERKWKRTSLLNCWHFALRGSSPRLSTI